MAADEHPHADIGAEESSASDLARPRPRSRTPEAHFCALIPHQPELVNGQWLRGGSRLSHPSLDLLGPGALEVARAWCAVLLTTNERGSTEILLTELPPLQRTGWLC